MESLFELEQESGVQEVEGDDITSLFTDEPENAIPSDALRGPVSDELDSLYDDGEGEAVVSPVHSLSKPVPTAEQQEELGVLNAIGSMSEGSSGWRSFAHGFESSKSDVQHLSTILEAAMPWLGVHIGPDPETGEWGFNTLEEIYGEDYGSLTYAQRKERILSMDEAYVEHKYKDVIEANDNESISGFLGKLVGSAASPTAVAVPAKALQAATLSGKMLKAAGLGAGYGAEYSALRQEAENNHIDYREVVVDAATAAVISPVFTAGLHGAGRIVMGPNAASKAAMAAKPVAKMSKSQAKNVDKQIRQRIREEWVKSLDKADDSTAIHIGEDGLPVAEALGREIAEAGRVSNIISNEFPTVADDVAGFVAKTGKPIPRMTRDAATRETTWQLQDAQGWRRAIRNNWVSKSTDYLIGNPETTVGNIDEAMLGDMRLADINFFLREATSHNSLRQIMDSAKAAGSNGDDMLHTVWKNGWGGTEKITDPVMRQGMVELKSALKQINKLALEQGIYKTPRKDYFPHMVKDAVGLRGALDKKTNTLIDRAIAAKRSSVGGRELSKAETQSVVSTVVERQFETGGKRGFAKERGFSQVPDELEKYYHSPRDSLLTYFRESLSEISLREFFGDAKVIKNNNVLDIEKSIGNKIAQRNAALKESGKDFLDIDKNPNNVHLMSEILKLRFDPARRQTSEGVQALKDLTHMSLLGQFSSAATQTADIGMTSYVVGARHTAKAVLARMGRLGRQQDFDSEFDGGVTKAIYELSGRTELSQITDKAMRLSMFHAVDKGNKNILAQASLEKIYSATDSVAGVEKLYNKYGGMWSNEKVSKIIADVNKLKAMPRAERHKAMTTDVKQYIMSEMFDAQPINQSQMPRWVQNHPNASLMTSLMSFSFKALDIMRKDILNKAGNGDAQGAGVQFGKFVIGVGGTNAAMKAGKDWLAGKDVYADEWAERWMNTTAEFLFLGKYARDNYLDGTDPANDFLTQITAIPAFSVLFDLFVNPAIQHSKKALGKAESTGSELYGDLTFPDVDKADSKAVQKVPLFRNIAGHNPFSRDTEYNDRVRKERAARDDILGSGGIQTLSEQMAVPKPNTKLIFGGGG